MVHMYTFANYIASTLACASLGGMRDYCTAASNLCLWINSVCTVCTLTFAGLYFTNISLLQTSHFKFRL